MRAIRNPRSRSRGRALAQEQARWLREEQGVDLASTSNGRTCARARAAPLPAHSEEGRRLRSRRQRLAHPVPRRRARSSPSIRLSPATGRAISHRRRSCGRPIARSWRASAVADATFRVRRVAFEASIARRRKRMLASGPMVPVQALALGLAIAALAAGCSESSKVSERKAMAHAIASPSSRTTTSKRCDGACRAEPKRSVRFGKERPIRTPIRARCGARSIACATRTTISRSPRARSSLWPTTRGRSFAATKSPISSPGNRSCRPYPALVKVLAGEAIEARGLDAGDGRRAHRRRRAVGRVSAGSRCDRARCEACT